MHLGPGQPANSEPILILISSASGLLDVESFARFQLLNHENQIINTNSQPHYRYPFVPAGVLFTVRRTVTVLESQAATTNLTGYKGLDDHSDQRHPLPALQPSKLGNPPGQHCTKTNPLPSSFERKWPRNPVACSTASIDLL